LSLPATPKNADVDYTLSGWFFPVGSTTGDLLAFGSLTLHLNPFLELLSLGSAASEAAGVAADAWNFFAFSFQVTTLAQQLSLNGEVVKLTSFLGSFMRPSPLVLGGSAPCDCDLAHITLLTKAIRATEFKNGLMHSAVSQTSYYYKAYALYFLEEVGEASISGGTGLNVSLNSSGYWRQNTTPLHELCSYADGKFWDGTQCSLCSTMELDCQQCYSSSHCSICLSVATVRQTSKAGSCEVNCDSFEVTNTEFICSPMNQPGTNTLNSNFEVDPQIHFELPQPYSVWTAEFWLRLSVPAQLATYLDLGGSFVKTNPAQSTSVQTYFTWAASDSTLADLAISPSTFYHVAIGYDGQAFFIVLNDGSPTLTTRASPLPLEKVDVLLGEAVFALKDLRVWSEDVSLRTATYMYNTLTVSNWPTLEHYWALSDTALSSQLTDQVTQVVTDLRPLGGLPYYAIASYDLVLCPELQFSFNGICYPCSVNCDNQGCSGALDLDCVACKLGLKFVNSECQGSLMWDSLQSTASSGAYVNALPEEPWTLDFYFKIVSASSASAPYLTIVSNDQFSFSNADLQASCAFSTMDFAVTVTESVWTHAAFVSSYGSSQFSKCFIDFMSSPKIETGLSIA
jgi:hypothetical protein